MNGIDYAGWRPPSPQWLLQNGFGFVCRYLKILPNSYAITAAEFHALRAAGVEVVLNWEENVYDWQTSGVSYAQQAKQQAQALGAWPCVIYFSVDTGSPNMTQVNNYFAGIASVLGAEYTGIYGGYYIVTQVDKRYVTKFWQTYAWSNGQWAQVHIRQVPGGTSNYDLDQAMVDNFGQVGVAPPSPPTPAITEEDMPMTPLFTVRPDGNFDWYTLVPNGQGAWSLIHVIRDNAGTILKVDMPGGTWLAPLACGYSGTLAYFQGVGTDSSVYEAYWDSAKPNDPWQVAKKS